MDMITTERQEQRKDRILEEIQLKQFDKEQEELIKELDQEEERTSHRLLNRTNHKVLLVEKIRLKIRLHKMQ